MGDVHRPDRGLRPPDADHDGVGDAGEPGRTGRGGRARDHVAVTAVLAVLLITGPLGDRQLVGSWTAAAVAAGVALAVAAVVHVLLRHRA